MPINAVLTLCSGACCAVAVVVVANMVKFLGGSGLEGKVMVVPFPVETTFPTPPLCVEDIDSWKRDEKNMSKWSQDVQFRPRVFKSFHSTHLSL